MRKLFLQLKRNKGIFIRKLKLHISDALQITKYHFIKQNFLNLSESNRGIILCGSTAYFTF